jgi:hypothetical protein
MMSVRVTIDTSALRADSRFRRGPTEALARYAEAGYVDIVLPKVVADEFVTPRSETVKTLEAFRHALREVRLPLSEELQNELDTLESKVANEFENVAAVAKQQLSTWAKRTRAVIVDVGPDHATRVLNKYFGGVPPFGKIKARDDFPDAFIFEAIVDLAVSDEILVVAGDKRLASALASQPRVTVYPDVRSLLEADEFDDLGSDIEADNVLRVIAAINGEEQRFRPLIEEGLVNLLGGSLIRGQNPRYYDDGDEDLYIETAGPLLDWELDVLGVEHLGEGVISTSCQASVEVSIDTSLDIYDDSDEISTDAVIECDAAVSISMDLRELRMPRATLTGDELLQIAKIQVDEILDRTLRFSRVPGA